MSIQDLGWNSGWGKQFEQYANEKLTPARVVQEHKNLYVLAGDNGELRGELSGRFRFDADTRRDLPAVGDWVAVDARPAEGTATIHAVLPRKSLFSRKEAGARTVEQVIAANIDTAFLLTGLDQDFSLRRIERYLTVTWESGASPVVILNKADLCDDVEGRLADVSAVAIGVPVHAISAERHHGFECLQSYLQPGCTVALLGSSGVGKSTLINALFGEEHQKVGDLREHDGRGRHTTTSRELLILPGGGIVIDTPGLKELQLWADEESLRETFEEIERWGRDCRFTDCTHQHEPGCAVQRALEAGHLDLSRLQSYFKQRRELQHLLRRQEIGLQRAEKARWKRIHKMQRALTKYRERR